MKNELIKQALIILSYWTAVWLVVLLIQFVTNEQLLGNTNFLNYDAAHYYDISLHGYHDFRVVFFPLFPKIWSLLSFSPMLISLLNGVVYMTSLLILSRTFNFSRAQLFFALLIPSGFFFFLPYSESFFFAASVLLLIGLNKDKLSLILLGLLITAFSRPAYVIFLPAILVVEWGATRTAIEKLKRSFLYCFVICLGTILVGLVEYSDSGKWFKFFEEQKLWGNYLQMPTLPLRSWSSLSIVKLDGVVFLIGLVALFISANYVISQMRNRPIKKLSAPVLFSILYIAGISLSVLLFRGGVLFSLNRFVFCTPFFLIFLKHCNENYTIQHPLRFYAWCLTALTAYWLLFFSFVHLQSFLKFFGLTVLILFLVRMITKRQLDFGPVGLILYLILIEFQVYLLIRFLTGQWVA